MADIDALLLADEFETGLLLVVQALLAAVVLAMGYCLGRSGRRGWVRAGVAVVLALAVAACCGTLLRCDRAAENVRGRLAGRIPGPFLPEDRAGNHLDLMQARRVEGGVLFAAAVAGGGVGSVFGRRRGPGRPHHTTASC